MRGFPELGENIISRTNHDVNGSNRCELGDWRFFFFVCESLIWTMVWSISPLVHLRQQPRMAAKEANGYKWPQLAANGSEWPQMAVNGSECHKWPRMAANASEWPQMAANGSEWPRMAVNGSEWP